MTRPPWHRVVNQHYIDQRILRLTTVHSRYIYSCLVGMVKDLWLHKRKGERGSILITEINIPILKLASMLKTDGEVLACLDEMVDVGLLTSDGESFVVVDYEAMQTDSSAADRMRKHRELVTPVTRNKPNKANETEQSVTSRNETELDVTRRNETEQRVTERNVTYTETETETETEKDTERAQAQLPIQEPPHPAEGPAKASPKKPTKAEVLQATAEELVMQWKTECKKKRTVPSKAHWDPIIKALKSGTTREDISAAITGCSRDKFLMGDNKNNKAYNSIPQILSPERFSRLVSDGQEDVEPPKRANHGYGDRRTSVLPPIRYDAGRTKSRRQRLEEQVPGSAGKNVPLMELDQYAHNGWSWPREEATG